MPSLLIRNVGRIYSGDLAQPVLDGNSLLVSDGLITKTADDMNQDADVVLDAGGSTLCPGLIDGHVHPVVGDVSIMPRGVGWLGEYMNAGVTRVISAGELTTPGLTDLDARICVDLAKVTARLYSNIDVGSKVHAGTLLLVPGLTRQDFFDIARAGGLCVKYIYYPFDEAEDGGETDSYREWADAAGLVIKLHCGGTSYRGGSIPAGRRVFDSAQADIAAHLNGGPIPPADEDVRYIVQDTAARFEIIMGGNLRLGRDIVRWAADSGALDRLLCGTDTPGGSGITPRAMLQLLAFMGGTCGLEPEIAIAAATGNVGAAHNLEAGVIAPGRPGDLILVDAVRGSSCSTAAEAIQSGEIPGVGAVIIGGEIRALPGRLAPPPGRLPEVVRG